MESSDIDELARSSPPPKKRKLVPVVSANSLLDAFGALKSPTSVSKMKRDSGGHSLRGGAAISYAESPGASSPGSGSSQEEYADANEQFDEQSEESDDELSADDAVNTVARGALAPELPSRSRRANVSYNRGIPKPTKKKAAKRKPAKRLLTSDTASRAEPHKATARNLARQDIALHTKPKRDAFLLANKDYFQPLLPVKNYIAKLDRFRVAGDASSEIPYIELTKQPTGVKAVMKPYQLQGLSFLVNMYENGMSAILGDEMGLGKTLQCLSLCQYLVENKPIAGEHRPFLVVCPLSVLSSWISEARKWVPGLNVVRFHGPKTERQRIMKSCQETANRVKRSSHAADIDDGPLDLLITTYETFCAEAGWFKRTLWRYIVLDEGHKIKNDKSDISSALQGLSAEYRLLLTGTPLQNNLKECWALLHWLFPEVFTDDTGDAFRKAFDLSKGTVSTSFMDDARRLLELVMLRRMKDSPGVNLGLPPKEEVVLYLPLTPMQRFWYTRLLTKADGNTLSDLFAGVKEKEAQLLKDGDDEQLAVLQIAGAALDKAEDVDTTDVWAESKAIMQEALQADDAEKQTGAWKKLMNLLMQLRKVCNHPYLIKNAAPPLYDIGEHIKTASAKFIVLDKLLEELVAKQRKKVLIFSGSTQTLNLCEELFLLRGCDRNGGPFRYSRLDGSTGRAQRNLSIRLFNDKNSEYKVMLLSTRAGGLGINLTSATDVVFLDEDWNPQVTLQAEARAHRIGQTQKVTVYKLCTQGTVEEQMMGRIRKKLYLSAKITESMRNIHTADAREKKRKRISSSNAAADEDAPHLDTASLQSLLRRGAQTLAKPQISVDELLSWDWQTTLENCKDKPIDALVGDDTKAEEVDEEAWLNSMEKVETAVFEGKRHQKNLERKAAEATDLNRADRRLGKNTTVEIDGFMINKESLNCEDWEAVPTFAGKDPRLAEPKREKKAAINNQEVCQCCYDGGDLFTCSGCPRSYHGVCLSKEFRAKAKSPMLFYCPQHECRDCSAKTTDAGGMIYRCRWCENGFCEDCLDFDTAVLLGDTLPEFEMRGFGKITQAYFIECPHCINKMAEDPDECDIIAAERQRIQLEHEEFLDSIYTNQGSEVTPSTISEIDTPVLATPGEPLDQSTALLGRPYAHPKPLRSNEIVPHLGSSTLSELTEMTELHSEKNPIDLTSDDDESKSFPHGPTRPGVPQSNNNSNSLVQDATTLSSSVLSELTEMTEPHSGHNVVDLTSDNGESETASRAYAHPSSPRAHKKARLF